MKIYTKTGDAGDTSLLGGVRVSKADRRVEAYGAVDETNAAIGVARAALGEGTAQDISAMLDQIQRDLFALGAQLADAREPEARSSAQATAHGAKIALGDAAVARLERWIDELEAALPPLRAFILPGGTLAGAQLHLARTVARRAERRMLAGGAAPANIVYINRLSDLLFVIARAVNHRARANETEW